MASCEHYEQQISALLDGELPDSEREELEAHLRTCEACAAVYTEFQNLSKTMKETVGAPPADLIHNVMTQITAEATDATSVQEARRKRRSWRGLAAMAACFALIAGVVFFSGSDEIRSTLSAGIAFRSQAEEGDGAVWVVPKKATDQVLEANPESAAENVTAAGEDKADDEGEGAAPLLMENDAIKCATPDEETCAKVYALLDDVTDADSAPESEPVCTLPGGEDGAETTTVWIDGGDVIFTRDGEHFLRAAGQAEALQALLNP